MEERFAQWADVFPEMESWKTTDARVFQTKWEKVSSDEFGFAETKMKKYFACVAGGSCYGVEVFRTYAHNATKECMEALYKVKEACDYYEEHGQWP